MSQEAPLQRKSYSPTNDEITVGGRTDAGREIAIRVSGADSDGLVEWVTTQRKRGQAVQ